MVARTLLKTEADYNAAIERTIELFDAQPGSAKFDELELLLVLVKDYENKHYQIPEPSQIKSIENLEFSDHKGMVIRINSVNYEFIHKDDAITITKMIKAMADKMNSLKVKAQS